MSERGLYLGDIFTHNGTGQEWRVIAVTHRDALDETKSSIAKMTIELEFYSATMPRH